MSAAPDTIAAAATAPGRGGIGVVRISGPRSARSLRDLGRLPAPRFALPRRVRGCRWHTWTRPRAVFPAPHSFTGEDVVELHAHGARVVLDLLVACAIALGARHARPGEFSERAFLNGKLDLVQAEAIADLVERARRAARAALRCLAGRVLARASTRRGGR